jgi:hypothetical protein
MARKSRRRDSLSILAAGRLIIHDSDSEGNGSEDHFGSTSPPPSEAEWLRRQEPLSSVKRGSDRIDVSMRSDLTEANTRDKADSLEHLGTKRMTWIANKNPNQRADEIKNGDQGSQDPLTATASITPRIDVRATYHTGNWI